MTNNNRPANIHFKKKEVPKEFENFCVGSPHLGHTSAFGPTGLEHAEQFFRDWTVVPTSTQ